MTIIRDIIKDAYREANLIPVSQDLTAAQETEGLNSLLRIVDGIFGNEVGEPLTPVLDESEKDLLSNSLVLLTPTSLSTYYLPKYPKNGARVSVVPATRDVVTNPVVISANGKLIEGSSQVTLSTAGEAKTWLYNRQTGAWTLMSNLTASSEFIFPIRFDDYFIISLAMRLNPRNGSSLDQQSANRYSETRRKLRAEYRQDNEQDSEAALIYLTSKYYHFQTDLEDFLKGLS